MEPSIPSLSPSLVVLLFMDMHKKNAHLRYRIKARYLGTCLVQKHQLSAKLDLLKESCILMLVGRLCKFMGLRVFLTGQMLLSSRPTVFFFSSLFFMSFFVYSNVCSVILNFV